MKFKIFLYPDKTAEKISFIKIKKYLKEKTGFSVDVRDSFLKYYKKNYALESLARKLTEIRVRNIEKKHSENIFHQIEISFEKKIISQKIILSGLIYDGFKMQEIFSSIISPSENKLDFIHIVITNRLISTFEDTRYHLRTIILGIPSIISLPGIVEAPAKPREYYILKRNIKNEFLLLNFKKKYREKFIDYQDRRIEDAVISYCLQAIFYQAGMETFCKNRNCCLYNAHYQEEVVKILVNKKGELCKKHQKILECF